jgi:hypothetical protein
MRKTAEKRQERREAPLSRVREMTYLYGRAASGTPKSCWRGRALRSFSYSAASNLAELLYLRGVGLRLRAPISIGMSWD